MAWNYIKDMPSKERKILYLTGKGKFYEDQKDYETAIKIYQQAVELTMEILGDEINDLIKKNGPGDYLYTRKLRQRMRVCKKKL